MSLAAARKSLGTDNTIRQPGKLHGSQSPCFYDSVDTSLGPRTPDATTAIRYLNNGIEAAAGGDKNGGHNPISPLMKEFEQRKQNFDDEVQSIVEVKSGHTPINPIEELRKLKHRFEAWRKDYKVRLREAKAKAQRMGHAEAEKHRRNWWGKKTKRF